MNETINQNIIQVKTIMEKEGFSFEGSAMPDEENLLLFFKQHNQVYVYHVNHYGEVNILKTFFVPFIH